MEVLVNSDMLFLVTDNEKIKKECPKSSTYVYIIDPTVFDKVKAFMDALKSDLEPLMVRTGDVTPYWEKNYHDKIVKFLSGIIPETKKFEISNSLSALGY